MAKVVTESPRYGHANASRKWRRRLTTDDYELDDHGPTRVSSARRRQYGWECKKFSDVIGPLRRYLRKQVGRPWDKVWSEISQTLDKRSLTGQHIFDHVRWEVEQHTWVADDGGVYATGRRGGRWPVSGLYVHPTTRLLRYRDDVRARSAGLFEMRATLRGFGVTVGSWNDVYRYRVDGLRLWERRECGWFIHAYRRVPERIVPGPPRSDGRHVLVRIAAHLVRAATKQASRKEMRDASALLETPPSLS
jgi:hypothetical protein